MTRRGDEVQARIQALARQVLSTAGSLPEIPTAEQSEAKLRGVVTHSIHAILSDIAEGRPSDEVLQELRPRIEKLLEEMLKP